MHVCVFLFLPPQEVHSYGAGRVSSRSTADLLDTSLAAFLNWPEGIIRSGIEAFKVTGRRKAKEWARFDSTDGLIY